MSGKGKDETKEITTRTSLITLPSRATGLTGDAQLRGAENYAVWSQAISDLVGEEAYLVMTGKWEKGTLECTDAEWRALDTHARQTITLSCTEEVRLEIQNEERSSSAYWTRLRTTFAPSDAQGRFRLVLELLSTALTQASPEALTSFSHQYLRLVARVKSEKITLEEVLSCHLLSILPDSLSHFQTSLALAHPELPSVRVILDLLRNELARTSTTPSTGLNAKAKAPPSTPCPACRLDNPRHWMEDCTRLDLVKAHREKRRLAQKKSTPAANLATSPSPPPAGTSPPLANLADLLNSADGVEAWLAGQHGKLAQLTLDSGSTHFMCGLRNFFTNFRACHPSAVGGISATSLKVLGVGSLTLRLAGGKLVQINQVLFVPGISTTLLSSSKLYDLHGIVSEFGKGAVLKRNDQVLATGSRIGGSLYSLDGSLVTPSSSSVFGL